ncbi:MAG TPA: hypothetical protein VGT78_04570 [Rhizomicrobium sp.]|nr:hypothetical protein [Rhizomicrobium sp.]
MKHPAKIALSVLALALACAHAEAAGMMLRRPLVTNLIVAPRPVDADASAAKIRPHLTPLGAQWARAEAQRLSSGKISPDSVTGDVQSFCGGTSACFDIANMPIEDAVLMMMMLIDNDAEQDMRDQLADMQREQQQKQAMRAAQQQMRAQQQSMRQQMQNEYNAKDSLGDMSQEDQLELQQLQDRHQKLSVALSNAVKKFEETDDSIVKNMK